MVTDHNVVFLLPHYKPELKRIKPHIHRAALWSEDAIAQLQGSLSCMDWDIFQGDLDHRVSVIMDYINFCISCTIPIRTVRRYPNSKPWITFHIKNSLREKHKAFQRKNWSAVNSLNRQIKMDIIKAKHKYKDKKAIQCRSNFILPLLLFCAPNMAKSALTYFLM